VTPSTTLAELARIFDRDHFAVVLQTQRTYTGGGGSSARHRSGSTASPSVVERGVVVGVVSRIDLLQYITNNAPAGAGEGLSSSSPLHRPGAAPAAAPSSFAVANGK
jgi:hypothetical protein